jgi:hypothetical protein
MALAGGMARVEPRFLPVSESMESNGEPTASVQLHVSHAVSVDIDAARRALTNLAWLGRQTDSPGDHPGMRRVAADLELPILDGSSSSAVRKAALVDVGPVRSHDGGLALTVAWRSATLAPLFPVFAGELRVTADGLVLDGRYAPPFGRIGLLMDAVLLHFVARRTAQAFLARIAAGL